MWQFMHDQVRGAEEKADEKPPNAENLQNQPLPYIQAKVDDKPRYTLEALVLNRRITVL